MIGIAVVTIGTLAQTAAQSAHTESRQDLIRRARVWVPGSVSTRDVTRGPREPGSFEPGETVHCEFLDHELDGRSPKFACRLSAGDEVKVKFGIANGEVQGEVAATRLLWALGFGADRMYPVRVVCRGCPAGIGGDGAREGERIVDPAVIERRMTGSTIEGAEGGWSWAELDVIEERAGGASRAQRDALKLLAVLIQHTDSKPEQQRVICLDEGASAGASTCRQPFMMVSDVGLTFGRANIVNANAIGSVNLAEWAAAPVWKGEQGCVGNLPKSLSGTLKDPVISEEGRRFLSTLLSQLSDTQLRGLFIGAGVARRQIAGAGPGAGASGVDEWVSTFKAKQRQIDARRCVDSWAATAPATFEVAPIVWLQSHATPTLTTLMNGVSLLGYTPAYVAIAVMLAFGYRLRAGAALLVMLALCALVADATKVLVSSPRPDSVDPRVHALAMFQPMDTGAGVTAGQANVVEATVGAVQRALERQKATPLAGDETYGFPSGHVAASTTFVLGLVFLFRWPWGWLALASWVPLMALSRMYLGRHFLGDVLGGFGVGIIVVAMGLQALNLGRVHEDGRAKRIAARLLIVAALLVLTAVAFDVPGAGGAGRLLGFSLGLAAVVRLGGAADEDSIARRVTRVTIGAACYAAVWALFTLLPLLDGWAASSRALLSNALPAFALLAAPVYILKPRRAAKAVPGGNT